MVVVLAPVQALAADSTEPASSPPKAEINALPPTGKGMDMVKPYQTKTSMPDRPVREKSTNVIRYRVNTPYSREVVLPTYRYGSPGYLPDGRGGRGYDYGYPGYRVQGGGGYPHSRQFGVR